MDAAAAASCGTLFEHADRVVGGEVEAGELTNHSSPSRELSLRKPRANRIRRNEEQPVYAIVATRSHPGLGGPPAGKTPPGPARRDRRRSPA